MKLSKAKVALLLFIACIVFALLVIWYYPHKMWVEGFSSVRGPDEPTTKLLLTIQADVASLYTYLTPLALTNFTAIKPDPALSFFYGQVSVLQSIFTHWENYSVPSSAIAITPVPNLNDIMTKTSSTFEPVMKMRNDIITLIANNNEVNAIANAQNLYFTLGQMSILPSVFEKSTHFQGIDSTSTGYLTSIQKNISAVFLLMKPILDANFVSTGAPSPTLPNGLSVYQCGQIYALNIIMTYWANTIPSLQHNSASTQPVSAAQITTDLTTFKKNLGSIVQTCQTYLANTPSGTIAVELNADYGILSIVQAGIVVMNI